MNTTRYVVHSIPDDVRDFFPMLRVGDVIELTDRGFPTRLEQLDAPTVTFTQVLHPNTAWFLAGVLDRVLRPEEAVS